jgi:hypothetical protein
LFGWVGYTTVKTWTSSKTAARWAVFFLYFSGDLNYVFMWLFHRVFSFSSVTIDNGAIQFINMPQAFAKVLFLIGILTFTLWVRKKQFTAGLVTVLLFSVLVGFKVYFGIVAVLGFCFFLLVDGLVSWGRFRFSPLRLPQVIWQKRWHFGLVALLGITSMVIFVPVNRLAGGLLWDPFTWPKLMLGATQLDWNEWWLRLQVYQAAHNIRNLAVWYGLATTVFLLTIYSTRLIGFIPTPKSIRQLGWQVWVLLFPVTVLASFVGMNFIQVSGGHNILLPVFYQTHRHG